MADFNRKTSRFVAQRAILALGTISKLQQKYSAFHIDPVGLSLDSQKTWHHGGKLELSADLLRIYFKSLAKNAEKNVSSLNVT